MPQETENIKTLLAPSAVVITGNDIQVSGRFARTMLFTDYPRYLNTSWLSPLINLDREFDFAFFINPEDSAEMLKKLRDRLTRVEAEAMEEQAAGKVRNPLTDTAINDIEQLRDMLQQGTDRLFKVGLYITLYGKTAQELNDAEKAVRGILEAQLVYTKPATFRMREGFRTTLPLLDDQLNAQISLNTEPLSSMFPFVSFNLTHDKGILYGVNLHNNSLVLFDRFDLENANTIIFGKSGGGKSIVGSEPVLVRKNGLVEMAHIGPLIEKIISERGASKIDEELEGVIDPGLEVWAFDKNLKGSWSPVTVAARKTAPENLYRFTTKSGRVITTTGDHNLVILHDGQTRIAKSTDVKVGNSVPLPRHVALPEHSHKLNLLEILKNSKRIYISGAAPVISRHYEAMKHAGPEHPMARYLYKYRNGRPIPIQYFLGLLEVLEDDERMAALETTRITSRMRNTALPVFYQFEKTLLKILGYIVSEGTITETTAIISNTDPEVLEDIIVALQLLDARFFETDRAIVLTDTVFVEIIKALGGKKKSGHKDVLAPIFTAGKDAIAAYLRAYFEGDGGVEHASVSAVSKSKKLISELCYLLYSFGIVARIARTDKKATSWEEKQPYWKLVISGQSNLRKYADEINFVSRRKRLLLGALLGKQENTNVDTIPGLAPIFQEIDRLLPAGHIADLSPLKRGIYDVSPQKLRGVVEKIERVIGTFESNESRFHVLDLPSLDSVIKSGTRDKNTNRKLWKALGYSWQLMKKRQVAPRVNNVMKVLHTLNATFHYSLSEIKNTIHFGFQYLGLPVKYFNPSLQSALVAQSTGNTSYDMLWGASRYITHEYQSRLQNIPRLRQLLAQLKMLARSDVFWDPIETIEKIENKTEPYVYDLTVGNEVFLAGTGGLFVHNSYTVKLEILRSMMFGAQVFVIDPENEYEYLANMVGGTAVKISISSDDHINPFDLPHPRPDETPADVLRSHIVDLSGFFKLLLGRMTPQEDSILDEAIRQTYASRDITPESDLSNVKVPLLSDFQSVLAGMQGTESLLVRIKKYTEGSFSGFLNNPTNVRLDNDLVVFSIRDMEDELKPAAMYLVLSFIWTKIRSELRRRLLVVDEAWLIMRFDAGGAFLFNIAKRARKYYLGLTAISQDIPDFMNSQYGKPIITNSSLQILLKQSPASIDLVKDTFHLTDAEKFFLLEAQVGHGLFFAGTSHVAIRIVASYAEDQIITSDPRQLLEIEAAKQELAK